MLRVRLRAATTRLLLLRELELDVAPLAQVFESCYLVVAQLNPAQVDKLERAVVVEQHCNS